MKQQYSLIFFASAMLASGAVLADDPSKDGKMSKDKDSTFAMLDADSDGKLSKEEVSGSEHLNNSFTMLDKDSDGFVTEREFKRNTMKRRKEGY